MRAGNGNLQKGYKEASCRIRTTLRLQALHSVIRIGQCAVVSLCRVYHWAQWAAELARSARQGDALDDVKEWP